jgi:hypothetical protein
MAQPSFWDLRVLYESCDREIFVVNIVKEEKRGQQGSGRPFPTSIPTRKQTKRLSLLGFYTASSSKRSFGIACIAESANTEPMSSGLAREIVEKRN